MHIKLIKCLFSFSEKTKQKQKHFYSRKFGEEENTPFF